MAPSSVESPVAFPVVDADRRTRMLAPPDPADGPVDVVLDTDVTNEIDDQFAIVWALLRPDRVNLLDLTAPPSSPVVVGAAAHLHLPPDACTVVAS